MMNFRDAVKLGLLEKLQKYQGMYPLGREKKEDGSPVTEIDLFVSELVEQNLSLDKYSFLSEEKLSNLEFPSAILDPIDGTRELIKGLPECSLSLALMESSQLDDDASEAWIYNPFTGFELHSGQGFTPPDSFQGENLVGMVSKTEWSQGLYKDCKNLSLIPKGSIAYKLGLLAIGACDFVVSRKPKNIWDIAAGSILLAKRGFSLYQNEQELKSLESMVIKGPLTWCRPEHWEVLRKDLGI